MSTKTKKEEIKKLFKKYADISINGSRDWDIKVYDDKVYDYVLTGDTLLLGEAYMNKKWDCDQIDVMIDKLLTSHLVEKVEKNWRIVSYYLNAKLFNLSGKGRAFIIGKKHYDLGNDLYKTMLDKRMVYTCGYWSKPDQKAKNLDEAQEHKLDLICKKINLKPGQKILDIGGGWGSFAKYAAEKYKAKVVNISVSKEQIALADELCKGLSVENRLQDYRDINEKFDHIVSLGMIEHVGVKNYRKYFEVVAKNLKDNGLFLLHTIGGKITTIASDPWIAKYIFPNSMIPSLNQLAIAMEKLFIVEDLHNFGVDYDKTLMEWYKNFEKAWPKLLQSKKYDEKFYRMWRLYLLSCAAGFRARQTQLWQIVLSKDGVRSGYKSIR